MYLRQCECLMGGSTHVFCLFIQTQLVNSLLNAPLAPQTYLFRVDSCPHPQLPSCSSWELLIPDFGSCVLSGHRPKSVC